MNDQTKRSPIPGGGETVRTGDPLAFAYKRDRFTPRPSKEILASMMNYSSISLKRTIEVEYGCIDPLQVAPVLPSKFPPRLISTYGEPKSWRICGPIPRLRVYNKGPSSLCGNILTIVFNGLSNPDLYIKYELSVQFKEQPTSIEIASNEPGHAHIKKDEYPCTSASRAFIVDKYTNKHSPCSIIIGSDTRSRGFEGMIFGPETHDNGGEIDNLFIGGVDINRRHMFIKHFNEDEQSLYNFYKSLEVINQKYWKYNKVDVCSLPAVRGKTLTFLAYVPKESLTLIHNSCLKAFSAFINGDKHYSIKVTLPANGRSIPILS